MFRATSIFVPISAFWAASEKSDRSLDPKLLFGGICLFAFVIAVLTGVQGVWL
jgi:hypothetical protein